MTQVSPTTILSDQASILLDELRLAYSSGALRDIEEITAKVRDVTASFVSSAGSPLSSFDPISFGEPPSSAKMNKFNDNVAKDVRMLQRQIDFLRSASLLAFNTTTTEVEHAKLANNKVRNKIKTLQLYNSNTDPSVITFHEGFASDAYFNYEKMGNNAASVVGGAFLALGKQGDLVQVGGSATIEILEDSNGFSGNNLEVVKVDGKNEFVHTIHKMDSLKSIADNNPASWFEFSAYKVNAYDKQRAGGFGFVYDDTDNTRKIDWSNGPTDKSNVLSLGLQFKLPGQQSINSITYTPHGMGLNTNHPVLVRKIQTSTDGTDWLEVTPKNVWVATNQNVQTQSKANDFVVGSGSWLFPDRMVKYVQIFLEQPNPVDIKLGHIFYTDKKTGNRVEGPIPKLNRPNKYSTDRISNLSKVTKGEDFFDAKRWGIGIRDINLEQVRYDTSSDYVSNPIQIPGVVDRVALDAETYVPREFGKDTYIYFYISGNDGETWDRISRSLDDDMSVPEIIAFNDPTPEEFREVGVLYVSTEKPVKSLMVRIALRRPSSMAWSTPLVRSYSLRVKRYE